MGRDMTEDQMGGAARPADDVVHAGGERPAGATEAGAGCMDAAGAGVRPADGEARATANAASSERAAATRVTALGLPPLTVAIQAGGESKRMGRSKATVPFLGRPLIERIVARVAPLAHEVLITTNEPDNLGFLAQVPAAAKIRLVRDVRERRGSLTGLHTALSQARCDFVAICACDMIFASPELFLAQYALLASEPELDVVVPRTEFGFEPFHAVYRRRSCLAALEAAPGEGFHSMRAFLEAVHTRDFSIDEVARVVPQGRCFINANTPDELAKAESIAREIEGIPQDAALRDAAGSDHMKGRA